MKRLGYVIAVLAIVVVAVWTYRVNYETKTTLGRIEALRDRIAETRESIRVLRVEWAWLNAPERLAALVARHNDELGLVPMEAGSFSEVRLVPFPPEAIPAPRDPDDLEADAGVEVRYPPPPGMPLPPPRPAASELLVIVDPVDGARVELAVEVGGTSGSGATR